MMATADNTNGSGDPRMPPSTLMRKVPQSMSSSLASLDGASADNNRSRESVVIDEELFTNSTTSTRVAEDHVCYNIGDDTPQDSDKTHEEDRFPREAWKVFSPLEMNTDLDLTACYNVAMQVAKVFFGFILFAMVWGGAVISKATVLFAAGNIRSSNFTGSKHQGPAQSILECVGGTDVKVRVHSPQSTANTTVKVQQDFTDYGSFFEMATTGLDQVLSSSTLPPSSSTIPPLQGTKCLVLPTDWDRAITHQKTCLPPPQSPSITYHAEMCDTVAMQWVWCLCLIMVTPYVFAFLRCLWIVLFRTKKWPSVQVILFGCLTESLYVIGLCMLVFVVLPLLDNVLQMAMVMMGVGVVPGVMMSYQMVKKALVKNEEDREHETERGNNDLGQTIENGGSTVQVLPAPDNSQQGIMAKRWKPIAIAVLSTIAVVFQVVGLFVWPITMNKDIPHITWSLPLSLILISCGYWENYIDLSAYEGKEDGEVGWLICLRRGFDVGDGTKLRMITSLWKMLCTFGMTMGFIMVHPEMHDFSMLFDWNTQKYCANRISPDVLQGIDMDWVYVWLINSACAFVSYFAARTAAKILVQLWCYALPLFLATPSVMLLLGLGCNAWNKDPCSFLPELPSHVFFRCHEKGVDSWTENQIWLILLWVPSQFVLTWHVWRQRNERLARSDRLFVQPLYDGILWEQSMLYNRNRNEDIRAHELKSIRKEKKVEADTASIEANEEQPEQSPASPKVQNTDEIPKIYICATMWHETRTEMNMMMRSIFKLDAAQAVSREAQKKYDKPDKDYLEFEAHIFFDDAMEYLNKWDYQANGYVKTLVSVMNEAARDVHKVPDLIPPPNKYSTPYGGRLEWAMPGGNKVVAHLKDKQKARHKKRWSQVMYMYYFLGFHLMGRRWNRRKENTRARNTMLLALDGDVDFEPQALKLLVDLMKRQEKVGAVCGRIHPVGSGPMVWYQRFEYALGHWLQKATEHVFGCVLCSPGCFSLFRGSALMEVMETYTTKATEARHFVQYDQGEDRWLCTLLLQAGWKVEYCAAADALTFAPEGFYEFFRQRRRWGPSSMANIMDLLESWRHTTAINDYISLLYVTYQAAIFVSSLLGTGTIFLMIVGSLELALGLDIWVCVALNLAPVLFFVILCFVAKDETQLRFALILTAGYALLQMIVLVGIVMQMVEEGLCSPTAIFFFYVAGTFLLAALLHPQEFFCIIHGFTYFLAIPSMYMLLIIYSMINLHVVSWGTRETPKSKEVLQEEEVRENAEPGKKQVNSTLAGAFTVLNTTEGFKISCGHLCSWICCPRETPIENDLLRKLEQQDRKMEELKNILLSRDLPFMRVRTTTTDSSDSPEWVTENPLYTLQQEHVPQEPENDTSALFWMNDQELGTGPVGKLISSETHFFEDFLKDFLAPLEKDKKKEESVANELLALRNKVSAAFLLANAMLVVTLLLLQINELNVPWPCGDDLSIEPIGFIFLVFYVFIMLLQTAGMLVHRTGTFLHIMATTLLPCSKQIENECLTKEELEEVAYEARLVKDDSIERESQAATLDSEEEDQVRRIRQASKMKKQGYKTMNMAYRARALQEARYLEGLSEEELQEFQKTTKLHKKNMRGQLPWQNGLRRVSTRYNRRPL